MSAVNGRSQAAQADLSGVLAGVVQSGSLEDSIRACLASICRETGSRAVSVVGVPALGSCGEFEMVGGHWAERNGAARGRGSIIGDDPIQARERGRRAGSRGDARRLPLRVHGVETGSVVLYCGRRTSRVAPAGGLDAWLGLLALLAEGARAGEDEREPACLQMGSFVARLEREIKRCRAGDRPLSLIGLTCGAGSKGRENGKAGRGGADAAVLSVAGMRLRERLRVGDSVGVGERGLWCLLPETDSLEAKIARARIEKELPSLLGNGTSTAGDRRWRVSSVTLPEDGENAEQLLASMTERLSHSKPGQRR